MSGGGERTVSAAARRYALFLLFCAYMVNYIDRQVITVLQEPIKTELGLTDTQLGLMTGLSFALFYAVMGVPIARLADVHSRKRIISVAMALWSGMTALCATAGSFATLLLCRVGVGVGEAGLTPPAHSLISDYYEPNRRVGALAIYSAAGTAGLTVGFLTGGWVNQFFGWRAAILVAGLPGLLLALVVWLTMKEPRRGRFDAAADGNDGETGGHGLGALLRNPSFVLLALGAGAHTLVIYGHGNWMPPFLARLHGMSSGEVGTWLAVLSAGPGVVGMLAMGHFADWLARRRPQARFEVAMASFALTIPFALLFMLAEDVSWVLAGIAGAFLFSGTYIAPCIAAAHAMVPANLRASTSALILLITSIVGLGLGPLVVGMLSDLWSAQRGDEALRQAMLAIIPADLLALALLGFAMRRERRLARARSR